MTDNFAKWHFYLALASFAFSLLAFGYSWWRTRESINSRRLANIDKKLIDLDKDLLEIKSELKNRPLCGNHAKMEENDLHMNLRLESIQKLLSKMDGRLEGINRMVDLLTQNELRGEKK